jgi:hypothetical protein
MEFNNDIMDESSGVCSMNNLSMSKETVLVEAKKIMRETMKTTWQQSTIAERKLAIYAAENEVRAKHTEAHI